MNVASMLLLRLQTLSLAYNIDTNENGIHEYILADNSAR